MNRRRPTPFRLTIAYEGTRYAGWQRQKGKPTIQAELESAFHRIVGSRVRVTGAGRTDSGVHALGQAAHAAAATSMPPAALKRALNAVLPESILVTRLQAAPAGFHARYSAQSKWYRYLIWNSPERPLFDRGRMWHVPSPLALQKMQRAARALRGKHDFRAFHSSGRPVRSAVRTLSRLSVRKEGKRILIDAEADGFLYHMVRRLAGVLVEVGKGKLTAKQAARYVQAPKGKRPAGAGPLKNGGQPPKNRDLPPAPTAPARGLTLMRVRYRKP